MDPGDADDDAAVVIELERGADLRAVQLGVFDVLDDDAAEARNAKDAAAEARKLRASMSEAEWEKTQKKLKDYHLDVNKVEAFLQAGDAQSPR